MLVLDTIYEISDIATNFDYTWFRLQRVSV